MSQMGIYLGLDLIRSITTDVGGPVSPNNSAEISIYGGMNITTDGTVPNTVVIDLSGTTNHCVQLGNASGSLKSLASGAVGEVLTMGAIDPSWQIAIAGGINWTREVADVVPLVINHGYINTAALMTIYTLPVNAVLGTIIAVVGESAGGWQIQQNAGQSIQLGFVSTSVGAGGGLQSVDRYDVVYLMCRVPDTTWTVVQSMGNILIA